MISFLVDQNFNEHIVDGLTRRDPALEFTHVRDIGMAAEPDPGKKGKKGDVLRKPFVNTTLRR